MLELGNVLKANFSAWFIGGVYDRISDSTEAIDSQNNVDDDRALAIIRELLRGNIADVRQSARNANDAISMVQTFNDAAAAIGEKLTRMEELAEQAASGYYSAGEKADMQEEFEELAEEINDIVDTTEYSDNKLFSAEGQTISISIGNGSVINLFASNLSFDIDGLDLTTDAAGALAAVQTQIQQVSEYSGYLGSQTRRLENATAIIEFELAGALGIESDDFNTNIAKEVASYAASKVLEDTSALFLTQANVTPSMALQLLKDTIEKTTTE